MAFIARRMGASIFLACRAVGLNVADRYVAAPVARVVRSCIFAAIDMPAIARL
jgi:hypothetical protein